MGLVLRMTIEVRGFLRQMDDEDEFDDIELDLFLGGYCWRSRSGAGGC